MATGANREIRQCQSQASNVGAANGQPLIKRARWS
jgi:hypothetical protein